MATIKNAITLQDKMSPVLNKMAKAMQSNLSLMDKMNRTSKNGITGKAFKKAQKDIESANNALKKFQNNLIKSKQEADGLGNSFKGLSSGGLGLLNANAAIGIAQTIDSIAKRASDYLDTMTLTKARLDLINDGTQTTLALQDKIMASADRARMSYKAMGDNVARLNMLAKEQFKSNDEAIAFVETLNKMFVVSGASAEESTSAMYQLSQAMAAGKLQGDEFRSIMENAPMFADAISKQVGKSKGELKELSSDGLITADIMKNSMFNYADEVEEKFSKMPMTFGQKMQKVSNKMMKALEPASNKFSEWLNSDLGDKSFNSMILGINLLAEGAVKTLELISKFMNFVAENVDIVVIGLGIMATMWGLAHAQAFLFASGIIICIQVFNEFGALALPLIALIMTSMMGINWPITLIVLGIVMIIKFLNYLGYSFSDIFGFIGTIINKVIDVLKSMLPVILGIGSAILIYMLAPFITSAITILSKVPLMIANLWAMIPPLITQAIAWISLNWPILLVAAAIGLVIFILAQLGVTFDQVVGFIVGLLYSMAAIAYNVGVDMINPFIIAANFIGNLFIDPIAAVKMLFLDMAEFVVGKIAWVAKALEDLVNLIPGVEINISSGLDEISNMIKAAKDNVEKESGVKQANTLQHKDVGAAAQKGYAKGSSFINSLGSGGKNMFKGFDLDKFNPNSISLPSASSFGSNSIDKVGEVGKIKGDVSITDEDIKLLKDIAATKFINSYTTLRPDMKVEFSGPINETADINKLMEAIEEMTEEAVANVIVEEARVG